jgi:recombination protein RecA
MDLAVKYNIIEKSGAWFSCEGERLSQGRDNLKKYLQENPKVAQKIEKAVMEKVKAKEAPPKVEKKGAEE